MSEAAKNAQQIAIRAGVPADATAVAQLSAELGYPATAEEMAARLEQLAAMDDHAVFVACLPSGEVVGWIHVCVVWHLQSGSYAEIGGLVTAGGHRSLGIGRKLVFEVESWARQRGMKRMVVRSNVKRMDAHRFYIAAEYVEQKTSAVFEKVLH